MKVTHPSKCSLVCESAPSIYLIQIPLFCFLFFSLSFEILSSKHLCSCFYSPTLVSESVFPNHIRYFTLISKKCDSRSNQKPHVKPLQPHPSWNHRFHDLQTEIDSNFDYFLDPTEIVLLLTCKHFKVLQQNKLPLLKFNHTSCHFSKSVPTPWSGQGFPWQSSPVSFNRRSKAGWWPIPFPRLKKKKTNRANKIHFPKFCPCFFVSRSCAQPFISLLCLPTLSNPLISVTIFLASSHLFLVPLRAVPTFFFKLFHIGTHLS